MKKVPVLLVTLVVLVTTVALAQLNDVPVNHWAYESVKKLVEMKVLSGFPDGTFRGNDSLTRYQAAVALDRLMKYLESKIAASVDVSTKKKLTQLEDGVSDLRKRTETVEAVLEGLVNTIRGLDGNYNKLSNEIESLKGQLASSVSEEVVDKKIADKVTSFAAQLNASVEQLESRLTARMDQLEKRHSRDIADINVKLNALAVELKETKAEIEKASETFAVKSEVEDISKALSSKITKVGSQVTVLEGELEQLKPLASELSRYGVEMEVLKKRVGSVEDTNSNISRDLEAIQAQLKEFTTRFASLENKDSELETRLSALESTPFASQIDVIKEMTIGISKKVDELSRRVDQLESNAATLTLLTQGLKVLSSRVDLNSGALAEVKVTLNNHREVITRLNTEIEKQAKNVKDMETRLYALEGEIGTVSEAYKKTLDQAGKALKETESLREEMSTKASVDDVKAAKEAALSAKSTAGFARVLGWISIIFSLVAVGLVYYAAYMP